LKGAAQIEYDAGSPAAIPLLRTLLRLRPDDPTGNAMLAVLEDHREIVRAQSFTSKKRADCSTRVRKGCMPTPPAW
jgi:hypothetical protein